MPEFDAARFIAELEATGELSAEEKATLTALAGREKAGKVFKSGFMAQSEFSSRLDKLQNEQKAKMDELIALQEELANSGSSSAAEKQQMREEMEALRESLADTEGKLAAAKIRARGFTNGEDFLKETGLDGVTIKKPEAKATVDPDAEPITLGRAKGAIDYLVRLNYDKDQFNEEYYELTGKYPKAGEVRQLLEAKESAGKRPYDLLASYFKLADLRAAKAEEAIEARLAAARREGEETAAAKYAIPSGATPFAAEPPAFARAVIDSRSEKPPQRPSLQDVRNRAITELREKRVKLQSKEAVA
jgi:hypothetical protein